MHCASLGEFEQGRPVLEALRKKYPDHKIVLTFFSPSGYEIRKDYDGADYVFYLPMDGKFTSKAFLDAVNPLLVLFVKYEFWHYYLSEIKRRNIPALLISAAFRKDQSFFKWYGFFFRKMLGAFTSIFVQDESSRVLLERAGIGGYNMTHNTKAFELEYDGETITVNGGVRASPRVIIGGDTRYDRVTAIAASARDLPEVETFINHHKILIAGSTWPADEAILKQALSILPQDWKLIIAPHEIDEPHINKITAQFETEAILYSSFKLRPQAGKKVLIVDNIGMLSSLYRYGDITFVGGGFNKSGIHNVLEPAVFGIPIIIGPVYKKFVEAVQLAAIGCVIPVDDEQSFNTILKMLIGDEAKRIAIQQKLHEFMRGHVGATELIMKMVTL